MSQNTAPGGIVYFIDLVFFKGVGTDRVTMALYGPGSRCGDENYPLFGDDFPL